ncbi:sodium-dependent lysophosphatidylcholine symporter 1-B-like [Symsagittifera roscoffensis]|uniref:sodium-dependent lysophosphatidylcholine symporter 1-B-like n=1 Tax=Symsagittifera roscoffensis TaxID=84072 RepID=UPI00307B20D7
MAASKYYPNCAPDDYAPDRPPPPPPPRNRNSQHYKYTSRSPPAQQHYPGSQGSWSSNPPPYIIPNDIPRRPPPSPPKYSTREGTKTTHRPEPDSNPNPGPNRSNRNGVVPNEQTNGVAANTGSDAEPPVDPKDRLHILRKLALAMGAAPLVFPIVTSTVFINLFLLETAGITARNVSVVLFVARAFDAISDPIVGILVNKTQQKGPSLKRWMTAALPFLMGSYFALWFTMDIPEWSKVLYYTVIYIILQVAFTVYSVPYSALIMYQTNNRQERDLVTAFRMTAEILFAVCSVAIFGGITTGSDLAGDEENCEAEKAELETKYVISALVVVGVVMASGVVTFFGTRERTDIRTASAKTPVWTATKRVMTHKPYVYLMMSYFCMYLSVAIVQGNLQIYFKHSLKKGEGTEFTVAVIILMSSGGLGVPLWQLVLTKFGKKVAVFAGVLVFVPALCSLYFVPSGINQWIIYSICFVTGFGLGSGYFMPWSMLPDVVDDYIVKYSESSDSIFYGFFVFFNKFAAGIGLGVSTLFLDIAGFDNSCGAEQGEDVDFTLRVLCAPGPSVLVLLYAFCIFMYPLNEDKCMENKEILQQRAKRQKALKEHNEQHVNPAYNYLPEYITAL